MPGPIVHLGATVICTHAGQALPTSPSPRVMVGGQPVVTIATMYVIAGCGLASTAAPPCVTGQWLVGATRVLVGGVPVAVQSGSSLCTPTGSPMLPVVVQPRVVAT
jgi:uncharacterized Zn-binding protein involved in type VI secretion